MPNDPTPCPTCAGYLHPRWDCPTCLGSGVPAPSLDNTHLDRAVAQAAYLLHTLESARQSPTPILRDGQFFGYDGFPGAFEQVRALQQSIVRVDRELCQDPRVAARREQHAERRRAEKARERDAD